VNSNKVADEILTYLNTKHARVYRNKAIQSPVAPYVVFRIDSTNNSYPSEDIYLNIDIYEDGTKSVRAMEDLADSIDNGLNHKVINTATLNLHFEREQRQYVPSEELVSVQLIILRYVVRAYFK
jgi:hypothetical protein